jgi:hypothetical protein
LQSHAHVQQVIAAPVVSGGAAEVAASILSAVCALSAPPSLTTAKAGSGPHSNGRVYGIGKGNRNSNRNSNSNGNAMSSVHSKSRSKFPAELVNRPFSLEAPALSVPLLKLARRKYVEKITGQQVVE